MPERLSESLSGGPVGSKHLPWDITSILPSVLTRLVAVACGPVFVSAKGAVAATSRAVGTNATARIRNA